MNKFLLFVCIMLCLNIIHGQTVYKDYTDGMLYVKLTGSYSKSLSRENPRNIPLAKLKSFESLFAKYNVTKAFKPFYQAFGDRNLPDILKIEFKNSASVSAFIEELQALRDVEYAEKVPLMKTDITPNDPTFPAQLTQINALNAWNVFNGSSNITLAIVDNAVMWTHFDLVANTYTNSGEIAGNGIDDDANGYIDDVNGWDVADWDNNAVPSNTLMDHGTHCAGIAGARTNNSTGIASIGWNIKVIPVKSTANLSSTSSIDDGYGGIIYAANARARVISCSWGGGGFSQSEQNVINYAWNKGCIIVAAAGNANVSTQSYPGAYNNVYCVASVSSGDIKSSFSNYGTWVDIAAPGEGIYSTIPDPSTGTFGFKSGTSMATPLVAGLAALMLSNSSVMTQTDVLNCISTTAVNIYTLAGNATFSATSQLGAGRIDAYLAMNCSSGFLAMPPIANFFAFPLITCPNTLINFADSSLYAPTSWTWNFQGGTPATSTSSNPSVLWASPGTYSVSLTVANANGNNTKTKLSYITVAGPIALPLIEGFQGSAFLPANWSPNNIYNDNIYWNRVTGIGGFGTSTACAVFDNYNTDAAFERDEMRTPKYIFSNVVSARLRFDVAYARYNSFFSDTLEVKLSTNCGSSWTSIYLKGGTNLSTRSDLAANTFTPTNAQWRTDSVDISLLTAGQGNVMFSFINRGHYGQAIYLDNINLAFPTPTINATIPSSVCAGTAISGTNNSVGAANNYTWTFPGGSPTVSLATNPTGISYPSAGNYSVTLIGANGTTTASVTRTIDVIAQPVVSVNTPTICSGAAVTLTASGTTNFTWTGSPAGPLLSVSPSVTTVYTVTGSNGSCSALKTATVIVNANPTITVNNPTVCSGNQAVLTPTGATSYTWASTTSTLFTPVISPTLQSTTVYSITGSNGLCSSNKTATVLVNPSPTIAVNTPTSCSGNQAVLTPTGATSYTWASTSSTLFTSSISPTLSSTTIYSITGSNGPCSAVQTATVFVNPTPTLTVPAPTICSGTSATVSITGASSYLWNTGAVTSSLAISSSGALTYTVTGTSIGCSSTRTMNVTVETTPTVVVNGLQLLICASGSSSISATGANTYSWNNFMNTSNIIVAPVVTTTYVVVGTNTLCSGSAAITVTVITPPSVTVSAAPASSICAGSTATLNAAGPYSAFVWTGPSGALTLPAVVSPATSTAYTVTANSSNGCSTSSVVNVVVKQLPSSTVSFTNASCTNSCSGIATAATISGTGPYSYSLNTGSCNTLPCNNLCIGTYTLSTTDAEGCISSSTFAITAPLNNLVLNTGSANASCSNCATGSASVLVSGGAAPYTYSWSPSGGNAASTSGLLPGCYTISVTDANSCPKQTSLCVGFDNTVGFLQIKNADGALIVYPNPARNVVTIDYASPTFDCRLYNDLGQLVKTKDNNQNHSTIDLSGLAKGVYFIEVKSTGASIVKKLLIE